MSKLTITWRAVKDSHTCPICRDLDGYQWTFITGKDALGDSLVHPSFGVVWNVMQGSQAHGHTSINCRCHIEPKIDVSDLYAAVQRLVDTATEGLKFEIFERYGEPVGVFRDIKTGRFASIS